MFEITDEIRDILDLGYALSTEPYYLRLFDLVMNGCLKFTGADAGDLYIATNDGYRHLSSINKTLGRDIGRGGEAEAADTGNIERNLVAYTAAQKKIINIADIYAEKQFEILSIKEFDAKHGYRTQSVLSIPMLEPGKNVIGVMQLINCKDDDGNTIPFPAEYETLVNSLCSQMAIALTNMDLIQQSEDLLMSFVAAMTTAIDARTPYNANHTNHVTNYCMELIDYINALHTRGEFPVFINEDDKEQLLMAAQLHDLGKMITPREVLNKSSRLGKEGYESLSNKLEKIRLMMKIDMLEGRMDEAEWSMEDLRLSNFLAQLPELNIKEHLTEEDIQRIDFMSAKFYVDKEGIAIPYLNNDEIKSLNIAKGTLTAEERKIVEQHVVYTDKMLAEINFSERYNKVRSIAANHHEYLNGTGYPNHLKAEDLDILTRLLTIADIYDSLTSNDRPYKGTVPVKKALAILWGMAKEGKLDESLVRILCDYILQRNAEEIAAEEAELEAQQSEESGEVEDEDLEAEMQTESSDEVLREESAENLQMEGLQMANPQVESSQPEGLQIANPQVENSQPEGLQMENQQNEGSNLEGLQIESQQNEGSNLEGLQMESSQIESMQMEGQRLEDSQTEGSKMESMHIENSQMEGSKIEAPQMEEMKTEKSKSEESVRKEKNPFAFSLDRFAMKTKSN